MKIVLWLVIVVLLLVVFCQKSALRESKAALDGKRKTIVSLLEEKNRMNKKHQNEIDGKNKEFQDIQGQYFEKDCELKIEKVAYERSNAAHFRHHGIQ